MNLFDSRGPKHTQPPSLDPSAPQKQGEGLNSDLPPVLRIKSSVPLPPPSPDPSFLGDRDLDSDRFERVKTEDFFSDEDLIWLLDRIEKEQQLAELNKELGGWFAKAESLWGLLSIQGGDPVDIYSQLGRVYSVIAALTRRIASLLSQA